MKAMAKRHVASLKALPAKAAAPMLVRGVLYNSAARQSHCNAAESVQTKTLQLELLLRRPVV